MPFRMMIPVAYVVVLLLASNDAEAAIGMNWGRQSAQRLVPSQVVDLLLQNGIHHARIFTSEEDILEAFSGSGINLTVGVNNAAAFTSIESANSWVHKKSSYFSPANIRAVYPGSYIFHRGIQDKSFLHSAMNSFQFLQNALNEAGLGGQIKATFIHLQAELKNATRPSDAEFRDEIKEEMITALSFLQRNNAPFVINMFPIYDVTYYGFDPSFAFVDNNQSTQHVTDINGAVYTNYFEFAYDSFIWALKKLNASNIRVIVGQVGWPTDGFPGASATSAEHFYKGLLPLVVSNKGSPMRPGAPIDVYIHSLADENQMPYSQPFTRHMGIYRSNGEPKYKIDLSGQGRDIYPAEAKGIMRMPQRWCMFNGKRTDPELVKSQFDYACEKADCTSLAPGGSCSKLSYDLNVSYAFNMYFQFQYQDEKACNFSGLGYISALNPSTHECVFAVEVVMGKQQNFAKSGNPFRERPNYAISFVLFLVSILETLFWD